MLQTTKTFWTNLIFQQQQKKMISLDWTKFIYSDVWIVFTNLQQNIEILDSNLFADNFQCKLKSVVMYETVYVEISERPTL